MADSLTDRLTDINLSIIHTLQNNQKPSEPPLSEYFSLGSSPPSNQIFFPYYSYMYSLARPPAQSSCVEAKTPTQYS